MNLMLRTSHCAQGPVAAVVIAMVSVAVLAPGGAAQTASDQIAVGRDEIRAGRTADVAKFMQLTEEEGKAFWPLYREYRAAMDQVVDGLFSVIAQYAEVYPNVPTTRAKQILKDYMTLEQRFVDTRAAYLDKFTKTLTPAKALLLAQVEYRLDLAVRAQLVKAIPLIPAPATGSASPIEGVK